MFQWIIFNVQFRESLFQVENDLWDLGLLNMDLNLQITKVSASFQTEICEGKD